MWNYLFRFSISGFFDHRYRHSILSIPFFGFWVFFLISNLNPNPSMHFFFVLLCRKKTTYFSDLLLKHVCAFFLPFEKKAQLFISSFVFVYVCFPLFLFYHVFFPDKKLIFVATSSWNSENYGCFCGFWKLGVGNVRNQTICKSRQYFGQWYVLAVRFEWRNPVPGGSVLMGLQLFPDFFFFLNWVDFCRLLGGTNFCTVK